ncbi:MAG: ATP-binding cassette domain-containing protein [Firmicutes bacterium]|nr:ATP-binding cassette domain-containing protein [Bacillota bacterium]
MNYTTKGKLNKTKRVAFSCLFWLAIWQVASLLVGNSLLLPSVPETLEALVDLAAEPDFYMSVAWTMFRCIMSILLSFGLGIIIAWLAHKNDLVRTLMTLPVSFFKAVPVMAIVIYVILVVKADWVAVVACFLMCFPIVYTNILQGLDSVSTELLEVAKVYRFTDTDTIKLIHIPSIVPYFNAAMKVVAGLSWKAVVAAEVLSVPEFSLGQGMISAKYYLETPTLFAYIIVIVALSLTLEKLIGIVTDKLTVNDYKDSKISFKETKELMPPAPALDIVDLCKDYVDKNVFNRFNANLETGSKTAVIGPSGAGKTTLARIIAGLEEADAGKINVSWSDQDSPNAALKDYPRVSYLFQEDRLFPWLNVYDNMALAAISCGNFSTWDESSNCDVNEVILEMAQSLEIADVLWKMPAELSGGMRHRVALGRTFLACSNLMILDEPFRGLDEDLKKRIVDRLWDKSTRNKTVIVISHSQEDLKLLGIDASIFVE